MVEFILFAIFWEAWDEWEMFIWDFGGWTLFSLTRNPYNFMVQIFNRVVFRKRP